jgi:hypothetical protein
VANRENPRNAWRKSRTLPDVVGLAEAQGRGIDDHTPTSPEGDAMQARHQLSIANDRMRRAHWEAALACRAVLGRAPTKPSTTPVAAADVLFAAALLLATMPTMASVPAAIERPGPLPAPAPTLLVAGGASTTAAAE